MISRPNTGEKGPQHWSLLKLYTWGKQLHLRYSPHPLLSRKPWPPCPQAAWLCQEELRVPILRGDSLSWLWAARASWGPRVYLIAAQTGLSTLSSGSWHRLHTLQLFVLRLLWLRLELFVPLKLAGDKDKCFVGGWLKDRSCDGGGPRSSHGGGPRSQPLIWNSETSLPNRLTENHPLKLCGFGIGVLPARHLADSSQSLYLFFHVFPLFPPSFLSQKYGMAPFYDSLKMGVLDRIVS